MAAIELFFRPPICLEAVTDIVRKMHEPSVADLSRNELHRQVEANAASPPSPSHSYSSAVVAIASEISR